MTDILDCGHKATKTEAGLGTGVARYFDGNGVERTCCYACATERERTEMLYRGRTTLYLTVNENGTGEVINWTGQLRFKTGPVRKGRHNFARVRYDVWFTAGGATWWGVQYGDNTQIVHCKRIKG